MNSPEVLAEALSAAEGGAISTAVLYPLEVNKGATMGSKGGREEGRGESDLMRVGMSVVVGP